MQIQPGSTKALSGWSFGTVQVACYNNVILYWEGWTEHEGSILINPFGSSSNRDRCFIDRSGKNDWYQFPPVFKLEPEGSPKVITTTVAGDHPSMLIQGKKINTKTGPDNYLQKIVQELRFCTIFAASDPVGNFHYLAHFRWKVEHNVNISWRSGGAIAEASFHRSAFSVDNNFSSGVPDRMKPILKSPPKMSATEAFNAFGAEQTHSSNRDPYYGFAVYPHWLD